MQLGGVGFCGEWFEQPVEAQVQVDDFTISTPQTVNDGGQSSFQATVTNGTADSFQWTYSAPTGSGNALKVNFTASQSAQTNTDAHWFAYPNDSCAASTTSSYTITATLHFQDLGTISKNTQLAINVPWDPAGFVDPNIANISGSPDDAQDTGGVWRVTGKGTLTRVVPTSATFNVPTTSQFRHKTEAHEQVHLNNWIQGAGHLSGDMYVVDDFYNQIKNLTSEDSELDLLLQIRSTKVAYLKGQTALFTQRQPQDEQQAHAVSDAIAPQYLYQSGCSKGM